MLADITVVELQHRYVIINRVKCFEGKVLRIVNAYEGGSDLVWKGGEGFPEKGKKEGGEGSPLGRRNSLCKGPEA